jgi:hypothetical protein
LLVRTVFFSILATRSVLSQRRCGKTSARCRLGLIGSVAVVLNQQEAGTEFPLKPLPLPCFLCPHFRCPLPPCHRSPAVMLPTAWPRLLCGPRDTGFTTFRTPSAARTESVCPASALLCDWHFLFNLSEQMATQCTCAIWSTVSFCQVSLKPLVAVGMSTSRSSSTAATSHGTRTPTRTLSSHFGSSANM